jgi:hypothetical protein
MHAPSRPLLIVSLCLAVLTLACSSSSGGDGDAHDVGLDGSSEVHATDAPDADFAPDLRDAPEAIDAAEVDGGDGETTAPPALEVPTFGPIASPPAASVLPEAREACHTIGARACVDGLSRECALWDAAGGDWAADVPLMTLQAYTFDRYYDLYHSPLGQAMDTDFTGPVPYGTPESEWSKPEHFERYDGYGDASGWSGTALLGAAARYQATGTAADYERLVDMAADVMLLYEITAIPGLLARSHYGMQAEGAPNPVGLWDKAIGRHRTAEEFGYPIDEALLDRVPAYYQEGIEAEGQHLALTPAWQGDASRDMYVRGLPGVMAAYDLLGDDAPAAAVKAVIERELPCTLNRMKKGRIVNLLSNELLKDALTANLAGPSMHLDEDEAAYFEALDTLVFYVMEQPRPGEEQDAFEGICPDGPPMEVDPEFELDASDPGFLLALAELLAREAKAFEGKTPIAWSQHVSVRGTDAAFILQWALTAHYLTGDERYLDFIAGLFDEVDVATLVGTYGSMRLPKWCAPHFGPSIGYPSLYNLLARIDRAAYPEVWRVLSEAVVEDGRYGEMATREDCYFGVLYHRMTDETTDPDREAWVGHAVELLATYGMSPEDKLEPDRKVPRNFIDHPDPEIPLEEIPAEELAVCTEPILIGAIEVPPAGLEDDWPRAVDAVPLPKRVGGAFLWQMDPWMVKREYGGVGMDTQWPMLGMTVPYWVGRMDGLISEGAELALAWRETGEICQ